MQKHPDGHTLLNGARWHYPKTGEPTECAVPGCTRVLGEAARLAALEAEAEEALSLSAPEGVET